MGHGIARFSPKFCTDKMRFWTLGQSEAAFWHRAVFRVNDPDTVPDQDAAQHSQQAAEPASQIQHGSNKAGLQNAAASQAGTKDTAAAEGVSQEAGTVSLFPPRLLGPSTNGFLRKWGLPQRVCQDITNPGTLYLCFLWGWIQGHCPSVRPVKCLDRRHVTQEFKWLSLKLLGCICTLQSSGLMLCIMGDQRL